MSKPVNRRQILKWTAAGAGGLLLPSSAVLAQPATPVASSPVRRAMRLVHMTDTHVQSELGAADGLRACLRHVQEHARPDVILFGGDNIFDAFAQTRERAGMLFDLWTKIIHEECRTPTIYTLGNHDIWGWHKERSKTTGQEKGWGKDWAVEVFGIPGRYYSVDRNGWHIVILDSVQPIDDGYFARLDDEQFAWLEKDLAAVHPNTPVLVCSHIPIFTITPLMSQKPERDPVVEDTTTRWSFGRGSVHLDARRIKELFKKHPNVKIALSGHIHCVDRIDYLGVSYMCNTAVSGAWWRGPHHEFDNGYTVLDLNTDGTFTSERVSYGWVPRES